MAEGTTDALIDMTDMTTITDLLGKVYNGDNGIKDALETADIGAKALTQDILECVMLMGAAGGVAAVGEYLPGLDLREPAKALWDGLDTDKVMSYLGQTFVTALDQHCQVRAPQLTVPITSITGIDTFATYWNGAGNFYDMLFSPDFRELYGLVKTANLSVGNCYSPAIKQGADHTNAMAKLDVASPPATIGDVVDITKYLAALPMLKVATEIAGSGTAVITVTGLNHAGISKTWAKSASLPIATGDYVFDSYANGWIRSVTAVTCTVATSGILYVEGWTPAAGSRP